MHIDNDSHLPICKYLDSMHLVRSQLNGVNCIWNNNFAEKPFLRRSSCLGDVEACGVSSSWQLRPRWKSVEIEKRFSVRVDVESYHHDRHNI